MENLHNRIKKLEERLEEYSKNSNDMENFMLMWVHQIKTPITAMNLCLESKKIDGDILKSNLISVEY